MPEGEDRAATIRRACEHIAAGAIGEARATIREEYPFVPQTRVTPQRTRPVGTPVVVDPAARAGREYNHTEMTRVFARDGFIDRYGGERLVFPAILRLLSHLMPEEFPYHPNWKMDKCHAAYWDLTPQVDHKEPLARGGKDDETNWITVSGKRNTEKSHATLSELGWTLRAPGRLEDWDGLMRWFVAHARCPADAPNALRHQMRSWKRAAERVLAERTGKSL